MIYGNKFLNYGIDGALVVESDIQCINNLLENINESYVLNESVSIKEIFSKIFEKIKYLFSKVIAFCKTIINVVLKKVFELADKAIGGIKRFIAMLKKKKAEKKTTNESALLEAENSDDKHVYTLEELEAICDGTKKVDFTVSFDEYKTQFINNIFKLKDDILNANKTTVDLLSNMVSTYDSIANKDDESFKEWQNDIADTFKNKVVTKIDKCSDELDKYLTLKKNDRIETKTYEVNMNDESSCEAALTAAEETIKSLQEIRNTINEIVDDANRSLNEVNKIIDSLPKAIVKIDMDGNKVGEYGGHVFLEPAKIAAQSLMREINLFVNLSNGTLDCLKQNTGQYGKLCGKFGVPVNNKYYADIMNIEPLKIKEESNSKHAVTITAIPKNVKDAVNKAKNNN